MTLTAIAPRRFWPWLLISYLIIVVGVSVVLWRQHIEQQQIRQAQETIQKLQEFDNLRAYDLCVAANESRTAIRQAFDDFALALGAASSRDNTPGEQVELLRRLNEFRGDIHSRLQETLGPRDCESERAMLQRQAEEARR